MFGHNQIRGQKAFVDAHDRLLVTSLFMTLQGEGPYAGRPAFFVRLAYCNLACSFCDTFFDDGTWFTISELDDEIDRRIRLFFASSVPAWAQPPSRTKFGKRDMVLVITGGEPMLQKNLSVLCEVMQWQFDEVQIESNGILLQELPASTTLVVSPKCRENSAGVATAYVKPPDKVLQRADCLKFVIEAEPGPYNEVPQWALTVGEQRGIDIYVSPMNRYLRYPAALQKLQQEGGRLDLNIRSEEEKISFWEEGLLDRDANRDNHEWAAQYAIRNGLRLSLQLHLYASLA